MRLSIVIPAFNEEGTLPRLLPPLLAHRDEIIVVDGGSTDATRAVAKRFPVRVLTAPRGRAAQMNVGAEHARGDLLWFLHADSQVPDGWREQLTGAMADPAVVGGAFHVRIDAPGLQYRLLDGWGRLRPVLQRSFYGDQGIFVQRGLFETLGGFSAHAALEDVDFSSRLWRLGKVVLLPGPLRTSARRWKTAGWWRTVLTQCRLALTQPVESRPVSRRIAVVILAKAPLLGQVKTRLIPALGPQGARDLAQKLLEETGALVGKVEGITRLVAVSPATHLESVRSLVPASFRLIPQTQGDLGVRLTHLFQELFAEGFDGVIVLGADHPALPKAYLEQAVAALHAKTAQVVLGPTEDGGYYLIGLTQPRPELFQDIPWGGAQVFEATLQRASQGGLSVRRLPRWFDVDRPEDLDRIEKSRLFRKLCLLLFLSGCAVLPLESSTIPHFSSRAAPAVRSNTREVVGVIHVHSTASDGQLSPEAIARIADRQRLDFLILTDHNTLKAKREGREGRTGGTLLLVGDEISTAHGHYLALRLHEEVKPREDSQRTADQVRAQGGLGFVPHPFWKRRPWENPGLRGFTGIEIYNAAEDAFNKNPVLLGSATVLAGSDLSVSHWVARLDKSLAFWDRCLAEGKQVVGIGGADAHGLVRFGLRLAPYGTIFKLVRNHLLIFGEVTEQTVYEALEKGHLFVAHDVVADARGFLFALVAQDSIRGIMGDRVKMETGLKLYVYLPSPGEIRFLKDGKEVARAAGQEGWLPVAGPGVYRVEATRKGHPWIYSNPVYVIE